MTTVKRNLFISSLCCLYLLSIAVVYNRGAAADHYPVDAKIFPEEPAQKQTVSKKVIAKAGARPGVYWYQLDDGSWEADRTDEVMHYYTANAGDDCSKPKPANQEIKVKIDMRDYKPGQFEDKKGNKVPQAAVKQPQINATASTFIKEKNSYEPVGNFQVLDGAFIFMHVITGISYQEDYIKPTGDKRPNTCDKHVTMYPVPMELQWEGIATETKEIRVRQNSVLRVGETKPFKAEIQTKPFHRLTVNRTQWVDVSAKTETTWRSNRTAVATVDQQGHVTAVAAGTATITAQWKSGLYALSSSATVTVGSGTMPTSPSSGSLTCTSPTPTAHLDGQHMDPLVSAVIKADTSGNERFDVSQGIPTSESLYGHVNSRSYLFKHKFAKMSGTCTYKINVEKTYTLKWDPGKIVTASNGTARYEPDPQTEIYTKVHAVTVKRPYSFWAIDTLHVFNLDKARLVNDAFLNGGISITPVGYTPPSYTVATKGGYYPAAHPGTVTAAPEIKTGGKTRPVPTDNESTFKFVAEKAVGPLEVENDYLQFKGSTIIDNRRVKATGPTPQQMPTSTMIGANVLYRPNNEIPNSRVNKADIPSSGTITYKLMNRSINGGQDQTYPIYGINAVTVHTPVVMYSKTSDDRAYNQKTNPNPERASFILDRPFAVYLPTSGQHRDIWGYGKRDYTQYVRNKEVKFPFDTYSLDRHHFYPKNSWIHVPVHQERMDFFLPVWVDEGDYTIEFRSTAKNAPAERTGQQQANMQIDHHQATDTIPVEVVGRLYDFKITDISDYNWETVFRTHKGSREHTGTSYWVGQNGLDGAARGNGNRYTLPITRGSHPQFQNVVIKSGYRFAFNIKTKGNLFHHQDGILITPRFYFVDKQENKRREVDIYYHTENKYFIKVGSKQDKVKLYLRHDDPLRNIPRQTLVQTAAYQYEHYPGESQGKTVAEYTQQFLVHRSQKAVWVGGYATITLTPNLRTFIGPTTFPKPVVIPKGVNRSRVLAAEQQWYGEYRIPTECWVVEKGFNIAEYGRTYNGIRKQDPIFLRDGFIIVNFDIVTVRRGAVEHPHLQYIHAPWTNQWRREGAKSTVTDIYGMTFKLMDGDVVFYDANASLNDDFRAGGTH